MKQHRTLIATDVPFWRKATGAQTRISSLVDYLSAESFVVRTFYLGQTGSDRFTEKDRQLIADQELDVEQQSSDQMPKSWPGKIGWYANQIRPKLSSGSRESDNAGAPPSQLRSSLRLADFQWPWTSKAFCESVAQFQPDSILIEYVKLSYLIDGLDARQRNAIHCVIDTHDALHLRCEKFKQRGYQHWIEISREEEARELDKFDTVIAIQPEEAKLFEQMAPHAKTIVCGYAPESKFNSPQPNATSGESSAANDQTTTNILSVGYLGSINDSNAQAIESFLVNVWLPLQQRLAHEKHPAETPQIQLLIGGSICQFVTENNSTSEMVANVTNIRLLGHIENIETFYQSVDVVINPVEFGTGLKIKSVEGLAFGKPLLSTPQGVVGLELPPRSVAASEQLLDEAIIVCQTIGQFLPELERLARDPSQLRARKRAAQMLAKSAFSSQHAYSPLKRILLKGK